MRFCSSLLLVAVCALCAFLSLALPPPRPSNSPSSRVTYKAAVHQLSSVGSFEHTPKQNLDDTLSLFEAAAFNASLHGVEVMVFPEGLLWNYGLQNRTTMLQYAVEIPPLAFNSSLCSSPLARTASDTLRRLSCLAERARAIVAANVVQYVECTASDTYLGVECPNDGFYLFNSEVVFENDGVLAALYRKRHLFSTSDILQQPKETEVVSFWSKAIRVQFGIFVCFDIEFEEPAVELWQKGVRDFLFSSSWENGPPLTDALNYQQGFSRLFLSNLIASNVGTTGYSSGSGIYHAGSVLNSVFDPTSFDGHTTLIADVPLLHSDIISARVGEEEEKGERGKEGEEVEEGEETGKKKGGSHIESGRESAGVTSSGQLPCTFSGVFAGITGACLPLLDHRHVAVAHKRVQCDVQVNIKQEGSTTPFLKEGKGVLYAFAFDGVLSFPGTPQGLPLSLCGVVMCTQNQEGGGGEGEGVVCLPNFDVSSDVTGIDITAKLPSSALVFPMVMLKGGQMLKEAADIIFTPPAGGRLPLHTGSTTREWGLSSSVPSPVVSALLYGIDQV